MPLVQRLITIRSPYNQGTQPFAALVNTWLAANPSIIVQDIDWARPDSPYAADAQSVRIVYLEAESPSIGATYQALLYQSQPNGLSAEDQFNAIYDAGLPCVPHFILDITNHERNKTGAQTLLVICLITDGNPLGEVGYDRSVFIAEPSLDIAAGATGDAVIYDAGGRILSAALPVMNVGSVNWAAQERNYAILDELTGVYIGLPTCCGGSVVVPESTTSTPYDCPPWFPESTTTTTTSTTSTTSSTTSTSTTTTSTTTTTLSTTSTTSLTTTTSTTSTSTTTSLCCARTYESDYDCDTGTWGPVLHVVTITDVPCQAEIPWGPSGISCNYTMTEFFAPGSPECSDPDLNIPSPPVVFPADCCPGDCCLTTWASSWDCESGTWGIVGLYSQMDGIACDITSGWIFGPDGTCLAFYNEYTPQGDCAVTPPAAPTLGEPPMCCTTTTTTTTTTTSTTSTSSTTTSPIVPLWYFDSAYNCDLEEWDEPTSAGCVTGPASDAHDWEIVANPCIAVRVMVGADCITEPVPGTPALSCTGCDGCCLWVYSSTYDCLTETWGTPVLVNPGGSPGNPCSNPPQVGEWVMDTDCVALQNILTSPAECSGGEPGATGLPDFTPPSCCSEDDCVDCGGTQPSVASVSVVGANMCGFSAGSAPYTTWTSTVNGCAWIWNQPGAPDTWSVSAELNTVTGDWLVTAIRNDAFSTNRYDTFPNSAIACAGGIITSGPLVLSTAGGGAACAVGDSFQVQFG